MDDLLDASPDAIVRLTADGTVRWCNAAASQLGIHVDMSLPDALSAEAQSSMSTIGGLAPGASLSFQAELTTPDGAVGILGTVVRRTVVDAEQPLAAYLRPQTQQESAGRLLRRMVAHTTGTGQTYFDQLVVHLATKLGTRWAFVGSIDPEHTRCSMIAMCHRGELVDPIAYDLQDTPCEGVVGDGPCLYPRRVTELFPKDQLLIDLGVEAYLGVPLIGRSGSPVGMLVLMHDEPLKDQAKTLSFLNLFAGRTATEVERQRAEEEARRQRDLAERLLDRVGALVLVLQPDGVIRRVNRTASAVLGWPEEELLGRTLWGTVAPQETPESLNGRLDRGTARTEQEWRTRDGDTRIIRWEAQTVVDDNAARGAYVLVTGMDLTALRTTREERDRLQERLRQARRLESLGRLAGGVAHDFNNLLLAILGYADLIELEAGEASEIAGFAAEIRRAGNQAAALTRQLLAFGRRQRLERRQLDLGQVLDSATSILVPLLPDNIELVVDIPDGALPVVADPGRLEQVIVNLGVNARDAMADGGRLSLRARRLASGQVPAELDVDDAVSVEVTDTGSGISDEVLPHIFEPFFTTKELGRGTGLGLASVYGTVQQHGGTLEVDTEAGSGTTFRIVLPLVPQADAQPEPRAALPPDTGPRGRVLVAEDDAHVRSLVSRVLSAAGYTVDAFDNGEQALEAWHQQEGRYDLVLADVLMPRMGGLELCRTLRAEAPDVRVVLTSGFVAQDDHMPEGVRLLQKPYLPDDLLHEIGTVLGG